MEKIKGGFFNRRIESPFAEMYKGYNQYIYTGIVDDLFLIDTSDEGIEFKLCNITEALVEFGKKKKYDVIITVNEDLTLSFISDEQKGLFESKVRGSSERMVQDGKNFRRFEPKGNNRENKNENRQPASHNAELEQTRQQNSSINQLDQITRMLKCTDRKTLVIFPYPEKMFLGEAGGDTVQKVEIVVKNWRDIIQEAHNETRTVLIVNPHRLAEFHQIEQTVSCYDHNCKVIPIERPPIDEMRAWLKKYKSENNIDGTSREAERVVLTGRANDADNLQNFVSWVQGFFQSQSKRSWKSLLERENQEAAESKEDLLEQLDSMIGLKDVKEAIHEIVKHAEKNYATASEAAYHMFFLGNPGTGKTVVANIIAKLFWAMELRTSNKTVEVKIHDIISQYNEGDTIQKMNNKIQEAMGGVLFIDEAYLFAESDWGRKAFQVLLTEMENNRKNLTVILAGYENRLQALKNINPGIDSRIPYKLYFKDYSKVEKLEIFKFHLEKSNKKSGLTQTLDPKAEKKLLRILDGVEGNGRGVRSILERTLKDANGAKLIKEEHIIDPHEINSSEADAVMAEIDRDFIGMSGLKKRLREYFSQVKYKIERNKKLELTRQSGDLYRIRFTGAPGTGKTSIARYMGKFFHAMGICETDELYECGATTLKGAYVGHAQQAVNNLFHENRGKVIFIDEIYSLYNPAARQDDSFSREVIDTMVRCLTAEEYKNTVVIVAGYKNKVDEFMTANPGLASRIPDEIFFDNYSAEECCDIFENIAKKESYQLVEGCREKLVKYFTAIIPKPDDPNAESFGNARTVGSLFGEVENNLIMRLESSGKAVSELTNDDYIQIKPEDIPEVSDEI